MTLSSNGSLSFTAFDGDNSVASLAFDNDGVGVGDDEITTGGEEVTVSFSRKVAVTGFRFLDLFRTQNGQDFEVAEVYLDGAMVASYAASVLFQQFGGYHFANAVPPIIADALVFKAATGNDNVGQADYALAALEIAPIPFPAALPLLGFGLSLLGFAGWRKGRATAAA